MATTKNIIKFRGMVGMSEEEASTLRVSHLQSVRNHDSVKTSSALDEIFAPDPITGNPSSDLYFNLQGNSELKEFVQKELQSHVISVPRTDSKDLALELAKTRFESVTSFADRVRNFITSQSDIKQESK